MAEEANHGANREQRWRQPAAALALVLVVVAATVTFELLSPGEDPATGASVGFNNNAVTMGLASPEQAADLIARSGAQIDRVQVDWVTLEPRPGEYSFDVYDRIYAADLERGVIPLFIFAYAPAWAAGGVCAGATEPCHAPPDPAHYDDAARTAAAIAQRYPELAGIEIWNEPNTPYFWVPGADPVAYTALLKACFEAIKEVAPSMPVAGASTSNSPAFDSGYMLAPDFIRSVYENGGGDAMDALSVHVYPDPDDTTAQSALDSLDEVREVEQEAGGDQPIWVTETGATTSGPNPATESSQTLTLLSLSRRLTALEEVEMVLFHTLVSSPSLPSEPESGFGIVTPELTARPAYCALAEAWQGSVQC